ncbi:hypothetical protein SERLA73DRAFT_182396 [Serpula lacrymans var. lacrymans S7.3]|uniref:MINDY deubiquitinase domain-containing protein n=2 Tax=Serpula lacrymans var. lacrymans TaxID=341189 RepID=F8PX45_SERL3|nr:uncharacterized protein SERLADRAFT_469023 [Serpula lacrymans var. lacrymans S7.9]EGN99424.1 hypothetical protein SERLA73DRAFT_182396 [Serpula lacrymans var. lacrymans S7.3]EGO24986.1 hypothetical protein SERLADRAFT_469023 [Serpula lacrymans var. lacrymans S7.9]
MSEHEEAQSIQSSQADVWYLKEIMFGVGSSRRNVKIVTQNFNGPCSFIAICNILLLRGNIEIQPNDRTIVSYEFLSQLVGEHLLMTCPGIDISSVLSIMPTTTKGLDLNPLFTGATSFRPAGAGGELKMFEQAGIKLVHGWLVDPSSAEAEVLAVVQDYDSAVNLIAGADHTTNGRLLTADTFEDPSSAGSSQAGSSQAGPSQAGPSISTDRYSDSDRRKIEQAIVIRTFLDNTQSQLTYYGLFHLASKLEPGTLVALFRNSHLSVLYKPEGEEASLYSLVTDYVFLNEPSVVWERIEDVDGGWSTFVDSDFVKSSPAGGDFAGHTAESALQAFELESGQFSVVDPADRALARQLQAEEDEKAHQLYLQRERKRVERMEKEQQQQQQQQQQRTKRPEGDKPGKKNKKDKCIIM